MKSSIKAGLALVTVLVLGSGGYLLAAHLSGGAYPTPGLALGGDAGLLRRHTLAFWEDLQFKDFEHAASFHDPAVQDKVDIPFLIERVFLVKPEALDIMSYEIVFAEIDSSDLRARVKTRIKVKNLTVGSIDEKELILYWHRASVTAPWYMQLESSLRLIDGDKDKIK
jgi:hypothetical protein